MQRQQTRYGFDPICRTMLDRAGCASVHLASTPERKALVGDLTMNGVPEAVRRVAFAARGSRSGPANGLRLSGLPAPTPRRAGRRRRCSRGPHFPGGAVGRARGSVSIRDVTRLSTESANASADPCVRAAIASSMAKSGLPPVRSTSVVHSCGLSRPSPPAAATTSSSAASAASAESVTVSNGSGPSASGAGPGRRPRTTSHESSGARIVSSRMMSPDASSTQWRSSITSSVGSWRTAESRSATAW